MRRFAPLFSGTAGAPSKERKRRGAPHSKEPLPRLKNKEHQRCPIFCSASGRSIGRESFDGLSVDRAAVSRAVLSCEALTLLQTRIQPKE